jgi:hypothetical protein
MVPLFAGVRKEEMEGPTDFPESSLAASDDEIFQPYTTYEHPLLFGAPLPP